MSDRISYFLRSFESQRNCVKKQTTLDKLGPISALASGLLSSVSAWLHADPRIEFSTRRKQRTLFASAAGW